MRIYGRTELVVAADIADRLGLLRARVSVLNSCLSACWKTGPSGTRRELSIELRAANFDA
jgi:hypothetical protein